MTIGGGAESMSRVAIALPGGAWPMDPSMRCRPISCRRAVSADLNCHKVRFFA